MKYALSLLLFIGLFIPMTVQADHHESKGFRHVVFFKFKDGTTKAQTKEIVDAFVALKDKIEGITDFEWGPSESVEGLNDDFTHCFVATFKDKAALEAYLPHPAHQEFVSLLKPKLDKVFVFDYNPK